MQIIACSVSRRPAEQATLNGTLLLFISVDQSSEVCHGASNDVSAEGAQVHQGRRLQIIQLLERLILRFSPHGDVRSSIRMRFPWTRRLEENWTVIREELDQILEHRGALPNFQNISEDQTVITTDDNWKTFLYGFLLDPLPR